VVFLFSSISWVCTALFQCHLAFAFASLQYAFMYGFHILFVTMTMEAFSRQSNNHTIYYEQSWTVLHSILLHCLKNASMGVIISSQAPLTVTSFLIYGRAFPFAIHVSGTSFHQNCKTMNYVVLQISIELCYVNIILPIVSRAHCILKRLRFNLSLGTKAIFYMWWLWIHVELTNHIIYVVILA
jgi:hypothetical protein